jgi:hypothetical protein
MKPKNLRTRTVPFSPGVNIRQVFQDGRWVDSVICVGRRRIPILGVANCTGRPMPEARLSAERLAQFPTGRRPAPSASPCKPTKEP